MALGAKGGVNYKNGEFVADCDNEINDSQTVVDKWPLELGKLLSSNKAMLQVVIDAGGGDILAKVGKVLAQGGKLVCYGMFVIMAHYVYSCLLIINILQAR